MDGDEGIERLLGEEEFDIGYDRLEAAEEREARKRLKRKAKKKKKKAKKADDEELDDEKQKKKKKEKNKLLFADIESRLDPATHKHEPTMLRITHGDGSNIVDQPYEFEGCVDRFLKDLLNEEKFENSTIVFHNFRY